jgi:hypothetical protein
MSGFLDVQPSAALGKGAALLIAEEREAVVAGRITVAEGAFEVAFVRQSKPE